MKVIPETWCEPVSLTSNYFINLLCINCQTYIIFSINLVSQVAVRDPVGQI
jgi:hypothetical protein